MKIFAFTDSHGSEKMLKNAKKSSSKVDLVLCCGDFTIFGHNAKKILKKFNSFNAPVLLIHGNHEDETIIRDLTEEFSNIRFIHKSSYLLENIEFFGYGGGGFSLEDDQFKKISEKFLKKAKQNEKRGIKNVFIMHGPPYQTMLDDLGEGDYCGNKEYRNFIIKAPIRLSLAGHIHENFYMSDKIKGKEVVNPGPRGMFFNI